MSRKRTPPVQLTVRIVEVATPGAEVEQQHALELLGQALGDRLLDRTRAEVAAGLGVSADSIDHERGLLDDDARAYLDGAVPPTRAA